MTVSNTAASSSRGIPFDPISHIPSSFPSVTQQANSATVLDTHMVEPAAALDLSLGTDPPPSPSNTSQSDDCQDFADLASSSFNMDDHRGASSSNPTKHHANARIARRGTLVPASPLSSTGTWMIHDTQAPSPTNLPHEIILHIFKYVVIFPPDLLSCLQVCKAWCMCGVELLWHRPTFYKISSLFKLIAVIRKSEQLFPYASFIRRLNFTILASQLEDHFFLRMSACTRLERLTLAGCSHITDDSLVKVFQETKHLVAIDLTDVSNLTDATLLTLADNCPKLQGINLTGCKKITSTGVIQLAKNCRLLRRVKLCGCENIDDDALIALTQHCPVLLEVDLINCPLITDRSVKEIWNKSYHMRELRLAHCGDLTDDAFPSGRASKGVSMLGTSQNIAIRSQIRNSNSAPASRGTSPGPQVANDVNASFENAPAGILIEIPQQRMFDHLRILDLTSCNLITDDSVEGIIANVPRIKNLILAKCMRLTDESVYSISKLGKNLHYLHLGHVSNITDRAVTHLARTCTRLRYIDLACCPNLTDLSVSELSHNLPKLRRIGLVKVVNLTDQAIYSLVERYTSLERIHLSYCENISVPAIFWLLQRLSRLTHLSLTGVPAFRRPELQAMCRSPPQDFNEHQRQAFCVFSGHGVNALRKFLTRVYSDEQKAAEFGELEPRVRDAFASMNDATEMVAGGAPMRFHAGAAGHRERAATDVGLRSTGAAGGTGLSATDQLYFEQQRYLARYANVRRAAEDANRLGRHHDYLQLVAAQEQRNPGLPLQAGQDDDTFLGQTERSAGTAAASTSEWLSHLSSSQPLHPSFPQNGPASSAHVTPSSDHPRRPTTLQQHQDYPSNNTLAATTIQTNTHAIPLALASPISETPTPSELQQQQPPSSSSSSRLNGEPLLDDGRVDHTRLQLLRERWAQRIQPIGQNHDNEQALS